MQKLSLKSRFARHSVMIGALVLLAPLLGMLLFQHYHETPATESLTETVTAAPLNNLLANQPLRFIENQGQASADVRFHVEGAGHTVLFSANAVRFRRSRGNESESKTHQVTLKFAGAAADPQLAGLNRLPGASNFYRGSDPAHWQTNVPAYAEVRYTALYPGVDLVYLGTNGRLKSEFHVAAGADPQVIRLRYDGMASLSIGAGGDLILATALGEVTEARPDIYQLIAGEKVAVAGEYQMLDAHTVGFKLGAYDPALPLVIDPEFAYLSYLGGSGSDSISSLAVNDQGDIFVTGWTTSNDFPTMNAFQNQFGGGFRDFFVTRIDTATATPVYSTFLGGSGDEQQVKLVVDGADNVYLVGQTVSTDFPTLNALQATPGGGGDAIIAKLASDGSLLFSTYLGGDGTDSGNGLDLDPEGSLWLAGSTKSSNFPTTADALLDTSAGDWDAFVSKLAADGSALLYSTYLGGSARDIGSDLAVDAQSDVFVAGSTKSNDFAGTALMGTAAFVAKLHPDGQNPVTLDGICIADDASANSVAVDDRYVFFGGSAGAGLATTAGAEQANFGGGGGDGMIGACLKQTMAIAYLSYLGSAEFDFITDIALPVTSAAANSAGNGSQVSADIALPGAGAGDNVYETELKMSLFESALNEQNFIYVLSLLEILGGELSASDKVVLIASFTGTFLNNILWLADLCYFGGSTSYEFYETTPTAVQGGLTGLLGGFIGSTLRGLLSAPPAVNNNTQIPGVATSEDPVNLFTGHLFFGESRDLDLGGPMPMFFQRYYASMLIQDGNIQSSLGNNWLHNFDMALKRFGETFIEVITNRGLVILFEKVDNAWVLRERQDIPFQLVESGADFILGDPRSNRLLTFDSSGKLIKIEDGKGNVHTLTYNGDQLSQVSDGLGRTFTFTYDGTDHLTSVSDGTRTILFDYNGDNQSSFTDAGGNVTTFSYDDAHSIKGLLTARTIPRGNTPFSQTYDAEGRVITQTDANGNTTTFTYNETAGGAGNSIAFAQNALETIMTNPLGNSRTFTHSENGQNVTLMDQAGKTITMGYDSTGRRNSITDRLGGVTTYEYDGESGQVSAIHYADGSTLQLTYTGRMVSGIELFDLTRVAFPDGTSESYTYDAAGNLSNWRDRGGNTAMATYNNRGQVLSVTNPEGGVVSLTYNNDATSASIQDPAGNTTTFAHDGLKRVTAINFADGSQQSFTYDNRSLVLSNTDPRGNTTTFTYDDNGNQVSGADPLGNVTTFAYDGLDRLTRGTDPSGNVAAFSYDELGRLQRWTNRNNNSVTFGYDGRSRLTSLVDTEGNLWQSTFDDESIQTSASDPLGNTRTFSNSVTGRLIGITSALGNMTNITRDNMERVTGEQDPAGNSTSVIYDQRGMPVAITLATGATTSYTRNGFGQVTRITDPNGKLWVFDRDSQGRLTGTSDPLGNSTAIDYDNRNRASRIVLPAGLGTMNFGYDGNGNLTGLAYSDGTNLAFNYDAANRFVAANDIALAYDGNDRITESNGQSVTRDAGGLMTSLTLAPSKTVTYVYDQRNFVTQITDWLGGTTTFVYDAAGRLINIQRPNGVTTTFEYNGEDRLIAVTEGELSNIELQRDKRGFISAAERDVPLKPELTVASLTFTFDAASQIEGFTYDDLGRLVSDTIRDYSWDLATRLTSYAESGNTITFTYDALGRRLSRTEGGNTTRFVWNDAFALPSVTVVHENGNVLRYYIYTPGGALLYSIEAGDESRRDYHFDEMGNTIFLTSDAGAIIASYAYTPYGVLLAEDGEVDNPFKWQGAFGVMQEGDSGLYYMRARYYDSGAGRFISRDPLGALDPVNLNPYQYALGNPLEIVDPLGLRGSYVDQVCANRDERIRREQEEARAWLDDVNSDDYWDRMRQEDKNRKEAIRKATPPFRHTLNPDLPALRLAAGWTDGQGHVRGLPPAECPECQQQQEEEEEASQLPTVTSVVGPSVPIATTGTPTLASKGTVPTPIPTGSVNEPTKETPESYGFIGVERKRRRAKIDPEWSGTLRNVLEYFFPFQSKK